MKKYAVILILVASFCGLANSAYLTQHEKDGTPLLCNVENLTGCNVVASSPYSYIFGISLAEYGLLFYGLLFALAALELVLFDRLLRRVIQGIALFGLFASIYFTFLQVVVINALCIYCIASAVLALLIFFFAWLIEPVRRRATTPPPAPPKQVTVERTTFSMPPSA